MQYLKSTPGIILGRNVYKNPLTVTKRFYRSCERGISDTAWKVSLFGVFLVRILGTRKTPNVDTFHAVRLLLKYMFFPDISLEKINLFPNLWTLSYFSQLLNQFWTWDYIAKLNFRRYLLFSWCFLIEHWP